MKFSIYFEEEEKEISINHKEGKFTVKEGEIEKVFDTILVNPHTLSLLYNGDSILAKVIEDGTKKIVLIEGEQYVFEEIIEKDMDFQIEEKTPVLENIIKAPMPGSVVKLKVKEGDKVREGDILIIVEAMKMENELRASGNMKVKKIFVNEGDQVEGFSPLIELE